MNGARHIFRPIDFDEINDPLAQSKAKARYLSYLDISLSY